MFVCKGPHKPNARVSKIDLQTRRDRTKLGETTMANAEDCEDELLLLLLLHLRLRRGRSIQYLIHTISEKSNFVDPYEKSWRTFLC